MHGILKLLNTKKDKHFTTSNQLNNNKANDQAFLSFYLLILKFMYL